MMTSSQQAHYWKCLANGCSPKLAEMLALGVGPGLMTDAIFNEGRCNGNQFEGQPQVGDFYKREAEAAGVSVKGKVYLSGLADYPGDPRAWVSGRGDAQRVCEERGWGCEGSVKVKASKIHESGGRYQVAGDIIEERVQEVVSSAPDMLTPQEVADVREEVTQTLSPNWK